MPRPTFGQDPMTRKFWWSCPYDDCPEAVAGLDTAAQAYRARADHVATCTHRPTPTPAAIAPPPRRPV